MDTTEPTTPTIPTKRAYIWISPRGFSNEGTVHIVPADQLDIAWAKVLDMYGGDANAFYSQLNGQEAQRYARKKFAGWAHTEHFGSVGDGQPTADDLLSDTVEASRWLWDPTADE